MPTLRFEGYSDDTFGCDLADHDNCANGKPIIFRVVLGADSFFVSGQYAPAPVAGWLIGLAPDEDPEDFDAKAVPEWPMRFERSDRPYSAALVIEAPDGVEVTLQTDAAR